jgi:hypothetical protein
LTSAGCVAGLALAACALLHATADARVLHACAPELPRATVQGGLVVGRVHPECRVRIGDRDVRVAADGTFLFGTGRDAASPVVVSATAPDGHSVRAAVMVDARSWNIERVDGVPPATVEPPPEIAARIAREQSAVAAARQRDQAREDFRFGFAWPARGRISGQYGNQRVLNGVPKDPHYGLDIAAPTGTAVAAPAGGVITFARPDLYLTGGTVVLDHGHGLSSTFIHLSRVDVAVGDRVEQGARIGAVGMTGRATGPHLHWGMNWFDVRIDPQLLLPP